MSGMILIVISVALAVALTIATLWFGDSFWTTQKPVADASRIINDMNQIQSAAAMFRAQNGRPVQSIDEFTPVYLRTLPAEWTLGESDQNGYVVFNAPQLADAACVAVNEKLGVSNDLDVDGNLVPPACPDVSDPAITIFTGCCVSP